METKFGINEEVLFEKDGESFSFIISEIRISEEGIYYSGHDDVGPVGLYKQSDLKSL